MKKYTEARDRLLRRAERTGTPVIIKGANVSVLESISDSHKDPVLLKALYVDWMSDPKHLADTRSQARFCQLHGAPVAWVKKWSKEKETQGEIRKLIRELFGGGERIKVLYDRLWEQADKGIISAIRLALELTGEYTPKLQHLDKPKSLEEMLEQMEKADKEDKAGVYAGTKLVNDESLDRSNLH
jgi:hypothetical protein